MKFSTTQRLERLDLSALRRNPGRHRGFPSSERHPRRLNERHFAALLAHRSDGTWTDGEHLVHEAKRACYIQEPPQEGVGLIALRGLDGASDFERLRTASTRLL